MKEKIQNKISLFINNAISMFYWIKNKHQLEIESQKEHDEYLEVQADNYKLKCQISKLEKQIANEIKLKRRYVTNCKNLRKELNKYENKNA